MSFKNDDAAAEFELFFLDYSRFWNKQIYLFEMAM